MESEKSDNKNDNEKDLPIKRSNTNHKIPSIQNNKVKTELTSGRKSLKVRIQNRKSVNSLAVLTKEDVFRFLNKNPNIRTPQEIFLYAKYLSKNFQYFTKLKNEDSQLKVEKLTKVCKLQKTMKGDSIINYGEIGDKFYIVLEGMVEIYKPKYVEVAMTPNDFINTLDKMAKLDGNDLRYNRIKSRNLTFFESLAEKEKVGVVVDYNYMKYKQFFIMEEDEKMGEFGEGFSFGDIALIKKTVRNATIKAKENCVLLTIDKDDYNKALLEFQKKKLSKDIDIFIKTYSFFKNFSHDKIINLFNCFTKKELFKGDYLYKQNNDDDYIYFINNGTFTLYSLVSFSWINDYIDYINYSGKNILNYIIKKNQRKITDLLKVVQQCKSKMIDRKPIIEEKYELWEKIIDKEMKDNLYKLKKDEEKLNDPEHIFKIIIKKIDYSDILGLEEVFEFKKRFCNCIYTSEKAEVKSVKLNDFLKLIIHFGEDEILYFINMIDEKKKVLKDHIIKGIQNIEKKIIFHFDMRYDNIIKYSSNFEKNANNEEKINFLFSTMKMKGYKDSLNGILDNNAPILTKEENKNEYNIQKRIRKNRSIEGILSNYGLKRDSNNSFKSKVVKNLFSRKVRKNEDKSNNHTIDTIYSLLNKTRNKSQNEVSNTTNKYNSKYISNSCKNISMNTTSSFKIDFSNKKSPQFNIKNIDNINLDYKTKLLLDPAKIRINNYRQKEKNNKLKRNVSMPLFDNNNIKNRRASVKDSITIYDTINLPNLRKNNSNKSTSLDKLYTKDNNDYNKFYNVYKEDKNFFLGVDFRKKMKKKYITFK